MRARAALCAVTLGVASMATPVPLAAQQFPFRHYSVADGLSHSRVYAIHQDAKGYLWIGTWEGLNRFDGYHFVFYDTRDGLGHALVTDIAEDPGGRLWIATHHGVSRLLDERTPAPPRAFASYTIAAEPTANQLNALRIDAHGTLWCATDNGLYRGRVDETGTPRFAFVATGPADTQHDAVQAALVDRAGRLWFATDRALIEIRKDDAPPVRHGLGIAAPVAPDGSDLSDGVRALAEDRDGHLLLATARGLFRNGSPSSGSSDRDRWERLPIALAADQRLRALLEDESGETWIGTTAGLVRIDRSGRQITYGPRDGLDESNVRALASDRDGALWLGTQSRGLYRFAGETVASFTRADGLPSENAEGVLEGHDGRIYAATDVAGIVEIAGRRVIPLEGSAEPRWRSDTRRMRQDRWGDWWVATDSAGVWRFDGPRLQFHTGRRVTMPAVIGQAKPSALREGRDGAIWVTFANGQLCRVSTSDRAAPAAACWPSGYPGGFARVFLDRVGSLWLGGFNEIARGPATRLAHIDPVPMAAGLPSTEPRAFFQDHRGRLWIGLRNNGVSVTADPAASRPSFKNYSTMEGLASTAVWCVTEDEQGRIYLGTGRGLQVLDDDGAHIRRFTTIDGLAGDNILDCLVDRHGLLWLATSGGVTRFDPRLLARASKPAPIYLTRIQAGDRTVTFETGVQHAPAIVLPPPRDDLRIEYVGLDLSDVRLTYQYQLEGLDPDWRRPTDDRAVTYSHLAPGTYRFRVRAVTAAGMIGTQPATLDVRVLPPIWQRAWFLTLCGLAVAAVAFALHRLRVQRLLAMERIRMQIATDLHDDIGSGLAQIAILTELAKRDAGAAAAPMLNDVAEIARESRDAMGDIIWAIDPRHDQLANLVQRLRQTAFARLEPLGLAVELRAPDPVAIDAIVLPADRRRHLLLIVKEAVTNIARHARARHACIAIELADGVLRVAVSDDGCGFDGGRCVRGGASEPADGRGLANMRARAAALGATLDVRSSARAGTEVVLSMPLP